jgi:hypothetical protein
MTLTSLILSRRRQALTLAAVPALYRIALAQRGPAATTGGDLQYSGRITESVSV